MSTKALTAFCPESVSSPPISTRSDLNKSFIAVPSAKNSGFDRISKWIPEEFSSKISLIFSAVRTGRVDFSIIILSDFEYFAISLAQASTYCRSAAIPAPSPLVLVGVFTAINIISDFSMASLMLFEKKRFLFRTFSIISESPGSNTGSLFKGPFQSFIF